MPEREGGPSSSAGFHVDTLKEAAQKDEEAIKRRGNLATEDEVRRGMADLDLKKEKPGIRDLPKLYKEVGRTAVETAKDELESLRETMKELSEEGEKTMLSAYKTLDRVASKLPEPVHFLLRRPEKVETVEDYKKLKEKSAVGGFLGSIELTAGFVSQAAKDAIHGMNRAIESFEDTIASIGERGQKALGSEPAPKQLPEKTYDEQESK